MKDTQQKTIHVAILSSEPLGWGSGKDLFNTILHNYTWNRNHTTYTIKTSPIYDKDIIKGSLRTQNYDVLLVPGGGVGDGEAVVRGFFKGKKTKTWKKNIRQFIENGGSYIGICGGAALMTHLITENKKNTTFLEHFYNNSSIGASCIQSYYNKIAIPLLYPKQKTNAEHIGAAGYVFSFAPGKTVDGTYVLSSGIPIDFSITKNNPLFSDINADHLKIRWWGGPALQIPTHPDRTVNCIASYPNHDISNNPNTTIKAWKYTGGIKGVLSGLWTSLQLIKQHSLPMKNLFLLIFYFSKGWTKTQKTIHLNHQNKAAITTEIYPNKHQGRILLCSAHPEYMIWNGGHIKEVNHTNHNCLAQGLHQWTNIDHISPIGIKELTATWWLVRRMVAWAGKINESDMPPVESEKITETLKEIAKTKVFWNQSRIQQIQNI